MPRVIMTIVLVCFATPTYAGNLMLVEFSTDSYDTTLVWMAQLEARGVTARHLFIAGAELDCCHSLP